ncbi:unnamed protein product [Discosporangium mesarthrocarpum]
MDEVFNQLAEIHQGEISFLKARSTSYMRNVEAEAVPDVSEFLEIAMVPTFILLKGGTVAEKIEGADPPALAKRVRLFASEPVLQDGEVQAMGGNKEGMAATSMASPLEARIQTLISASPVMLFMKGNADTPRCKFSRKMVEILRGAKVDFGSFDILTDEHIRQGLKVYSNWPTYPQLYAKGQLIGGVDIIMEMAAEGDLRAQFGLDLPVKKTDNTEEMEAGNKAHAKTSVEERCKALIGSAEVMLFMKGSPEEPRCGFSRKIVQILQEEKLEFSTFDILQDPDVRQSLKELSNWPTYPQLYVRGTLMGGIDVVKEMREEGPLADQIGVSTKETLEERIKSLLASSRVLLFMKGNPETPRCGFSREAIALLQKEGVKFETFDILKDEDVRLGLKKLSNWPTYPQLYVDGKLLGGLDIMKEMDAAGELHPAIAPQG